MRRCGGCTLCCRLLPVRELGKGAGVRCKNQKYGVGCTVYQKPWSPLRGGMPPSCRLWTCRWLIDQDARDLARPDRSHYVIDVMPDYVVAQDGPDGERIKIGAIQVWVDPKHPDAHRDPALRAYLERRAQDGVVAIIRYNSYDGFTLVAPSMSPDGQWHEIQSAVETEHPIAEIFRLEKALHVA